MRNKSGFDSQYQKKVKLIDSKGHLEEKFKSLTFRLLLIRIKMEYNRLILMKIKEDAYLLFQVGLKFKNI